MLEQGKHITPSYKIKKVVKKNQKDWDVIADNHEAIISVEVFELVQKLMNTDTRTSPNNDKVFLFAGKLYCGDCSESMVKQYENQKTMNIRILSAEIINIIHYVHVIQ